MVRTIFGLLLAAAVTATSQSCLPAAPATQGTSAEPQFTKYIFVVRSPRRSMDQGDPNTFDRADFDEILKDLPNRPDSRVQTGISFIFSCFRSPPEITVKSLEKFLLLAEETSTPVFIHLDAEHWWGARPDLWNWWDPAQPGYDPANRENVEWTGWSPDNAIKICWRNWGSQLRVLPAPNLASPKYVQSCREQIRLLVSVVLKWHARLPEPKKHLFVGLKVGHESAIGVNAFHYPNGNDLLNKPAADDPKLALVHDDVLARGVQQIGYAAVKTSGLRTSGKITEQDLFEVVRRYVEMLSREAAQCGVPRDKLFAHGVGWKDGELLDDAAVNQYSCPGWSFYRYADDPMKDVAVRRNLASSDAPYWGAVEWLSHKPHETKIWKAALVNTLADKRCRLLCIFNWESIHRSEEVKAAIRQVVLENFPGAK